MPKNNSTLIYVFVNNNFQYTEGSFKSDYSYSNIPQYYIDTLTHNSNKFENVYLLTQKEEIEKLKDLPSNVTLIDVEEEICKTSEFIEAQDVINKLWLRYKNDTFWYTTFIRVLLLTIFVKLKNTQNNIHVEGDNIIFADDTHINNVNSLFESGEFGYCCEAPNSSAPSLIFLKDGASGASLFNKHLSLLKKGEDTLRPYVGHFGNYITDMAFLDIIRRNKKDYKMLPCVPEGPFAENLETVQCLFDPTSYGQFLGGTNNGHPQGYTEYRHYVGQQIIDRVIHPYFESGVPFVFNNKDEKHIPLYNLHVHNKAVIKKFLDALPKDVSNE